MQTANNLALLLRKRNDCLAIIFAKFIAYALKCAKDQTLSNVRV